MKLRKCGFPDNFGRCCSLIDRYSSVLPLVKLETKCHEAHMIFSFSGSSTERPHISNLLLLSMFAIAARYDQAELPPLDPGNLWEAGLDYMVQAREVLSMLPCLLSSVIASIFTLSETVFTIIAGGQRVKLFYFWDYENLALVRHTSHVASHEMFRNLNLQARWSMAGSTQVGKAVIHPRSLINQSRRRDGISHGALVVMDIRNLFVQSAMV